MVVVLDPYRVLKLPHSASALQIKRAYRSLALQHHPDRRRRVDDEMDNSTDRDSDNNDFAEIAQAYALLSDAKRKAAYDHIYKYGGYDCQQQQPATTTKQQQQDRGEVGIGYTCSDPLLSFLWTQGRIQYTRTVAGIQIPSRRRQHVGGSSNNSLRVAISSGQCFRRDPTTGRRAYRSQTTQFLGGHAQRQERFITRSETTTVVHPNGLKEVVVVDHLSSGDEEKRYYYVSPPSSPGATTTTTSSSSPWYVSVWGDLRESLTRCYSPCTPVH